MTKKVQQLIKEIDSLRSEEKGVLIQALVAKGLITPYVDPFALLRENIPATLSDKQVSSTQSGAQARRMRGASAEP
jgi:hypothetical protein